MMEIPKDVSQARTLRPFTKNTASELVLDTSML